MKYLLLLLPSLAFAAPLPEKSISSMMAQSEYVMSQGVCQVANGDTASGTVILILPAPVGVRRISRADYNWIKEVGYQKGSSGLFLMTERIQEACSQDALNSRCIAARSLWNANWSGR